MKKIIILFVAVFSLGFTANAQTISKREAKKISAEINSNVKKLEQAIDKTDWNQVEKVVNLTVKSLEKNAESAAVILENINLGQFIKTMTKFAEAVEQNVDSKELEETVGRIEKRFKSAFIKMMAEDTK